MKKIFWLLSLMLLLSLALPGIAEASLEIDGHYHFIFDQSIEADGQEFYSMNGIPGAVFGVGGWKQSTSDNPNENRNKFQSILELEMYGQVGNNVFLDASFENLYDEFLGYPNGTGSTREQGASTVRDNQPLRLKDLIVTVDTEIAEITITNSFNYDFNDRILAAQLEDDWGELNPYGQGVLVDSDMFGIETKGFIFQASQKEGDDNLASSDGDEIIVDREDRAKPADKLVLGADFKKSLANGELGAMVVNTKDKSSNLGGANFDKDLDTIHLAANAEYDLTYSVDLYGEFITALYGDDLEEVMNARNSSWAPESFDLGEKEDTSVIEIGATVNLIPGLEISGDYTDVGEDYFAVVGAGHSMDYWFGDANFDPDREHGTGYHKGFSLSSNYMLPIMYYPILKVDFSDYENTRSAVGDNENTKEQETRVGLELDRGVWNAETSYRYKNVGNSGSGKLDQTDLDYHDINFNLSYNLMTTNEYSINLNTDLNYYTGYDNVDDYNFSTEMRGMLGIDADYDLNQLLDLTASYDFGYATENNDVFENASAMQNLFKLGASYQVTPNSSFDLMYKYDNYKLDRYASAEDLERSSHKKESEHRWYDGGEWWQHSDGGSGDWSWLRNVAPDYDGYRTHQIKATFNTRF